MEATENRKSTSHLYRKDVLKDSFAKTSTRRRSGSTSKGTLRSPHAPANSFPSSFAVSSLPTSSNASWPGTPSTNSKSLPMSKWQTYRQAPTLPRTWTLKPKTLKSWLDSTGHCFPRSAASNSICWPMAKMGHFWSWSSWPVTSVPGITLAWRMLSVS